MLITILIAFFSIIALLVIHEFGHFIAAKKFGIEVEEFGVGLPPRLFGKKFGGTLYSLNLLPFGAFVKIPGVDGEKENCKNLENVPTWQKAVILLAGVISFWIVGILLLTIVFSLGTSQAISDEETGPFLDPPKVQIAAVAIGSPAETAGIKAGDVVRGLKSGDYQLPVDKVKEIQKFIEDYKGEEVILVIERGQDDFEAGLVPRVVSPEGEGSIGVILVRTTEMSYNLFQAFIRGISTVANLTVAVIVGLAEVVISLIKGQGLPPGVQFMGPIGMGALVVQAVRVGLSYYLQFIAMISIYLAVFNLLPIPALDGGKLLFLVIGKIKGCPVNQKIEQNITAGFFILLLTLMALVTIKDVVRLF
ncbi:MAG: site-2 protease family protein [bacterium]|nr:site-2 protease family protein [bacterium]